MVVLWHITFDIIESIFIHFAFVLIYRFVEWVEKSASCSASNEMKILQSPLSRMKKKSEWNKKKKKIQWFDRELNSMQSSSNWLNLSELRFLNYVLLDSFSNFFFFLRRFETFIQSISFRYFFPSFYRMMLALLVSISIYLYFKFMWWSVREQKSWYGVDTG